MAISADLPAELEDRVEEEIKSGRYQSKSEFLRDAVRLKLIESDLEIRVISNDTREELMERVRKNKVDEAAEDHFYNSEYYSKFYDHHGQVRDKLDFDIDHEPISFHTERNSS
ncbi:MAG: type II toxin-antitoxin system ParD family antitoxin [Candidatus Nanohalobium sp.]